MSVYTARRPSRINGQQLGMYSLSFGDANKTIEDGTLGKINKLRNAIAVSFAPRTLEELEKIYRIHGKPPRNISPEDELEQRRLRVIDAMIADQRLIYSQEKWMLISQLQPENKKKYQAKIEHAVAIAISHMHTCDFPLLISILTQMGPKAIDSAISKALEWKGGVVNTHFDETSFLMLAQLGSQDKQRECIDYITKERSFSYHPRTIATLALGCEQNDRIRIAQDLFGLKLFDFHDAAIELLRSCSDEAIQTFPDDIQDEVKKISPQVKIGLAPSTIDRIKNHATELPQIYRQPSDFDPTISPLHDIARHGEVTRFPKTHTETFVLPLEDEASVRIIDKESALGWLNVYLAPDIWAEAGFSYVPVEPIIDISRNAEGAYHVMTVNLRGRALDHCTDLLHAYSPEIQDCINDMFRTMRKVIEGQGIDHQHLEERNIVVVPKVDDNGNIDLSVCPRLYAIDFDMTVYRSSTPRLEALSRVPAAQIMR